MTLLQLKYIVTVAAAGTISEAAKQLYIAQPSLTSAIKELENDLDLVGNRYDRFRNIGISAVIKE